MQTDGARPAKGSLTKEALSLLRNKSYIMLLFFVALNSLAVVPMFVFMIEYVKTVGGGSGDVPMIFFLRCVAEVPTFILLSYVGKRISSKNLLMTGVGFTMIYITGLIFVDTIFWLSAINLVGAAGFILTLTGRLRYLQETTPEAVRSTSISVMSACEIGLGSIAGNLIAGFLIAGYGIRIHAMTSLGALILAFFIILLCLRKN
jgi:predicted MFS family arabinose efflux permease